MRPTRIHRLDAIRGVLAIAIMCYHVLDGPLVVGTYGVYAFFILSGFALEHSYRGKALGRPFAVARVARLAPLWLPVVLVSALVYGPLNVWALVLSASGAFSFIPGHYSVVQGGWSIGMEVVFYVLFPLVRALSTRWLVAFVAGAYAARVVYVHAVWPVGSTIYDVWTQYTVLPSFLVFFVLGMALARIGDTAPWTGRRARVATILGDLSYGTYLLHPLAWIAFSGNALAAIAVTPVIALLVHRFWEAPVGVLIKRRWSGRRAHNERRLETATAAPHAEPSWAG